MKLLRPLRERDFALLWTGMTVSLLGDGIFIVAEAWQVYDIENDPVALSLVGLAWTGGMTAFLLTGGIVSDRMERRKVLIAADLVRALVLAATGVLSLAGVLEIWHLVVLAVLYGAGEAFFGPAFGALVPEIVAPRHLVEANSLEQLVRQAVRAAARARGRRLRRRGRRRRRRLPDRRGHLHHQRRVHLGAARALAAGARSPSARRAASCARPSPSCARSRGCGPRWWRPR